MKSMIAAAAAYAIFIKKIFKINIMLDDINSIVNSNN